MDAIEQSVSNDRDCGVFGSSVFSVFLRSPAQAKAMAKRAAEPEVSERCGSCIIAPFNCLRKAWEAPPGRMYRGVPACVSHYGCSL